MLCFNAYHAALLRKGSTFKANKGINRTTAGSEQSDITEEEPPTMADQSKERVHSTSQLD